MFDYIQRWWYKIIGCKVRVDTPVYDSMVQQLIEIHRGVQEVKTRLSEDRELLVKELKKKNKIIHTMIEFLPDMLWFKDLDGKYVYANKAIRENLLFCDNPIGFTDVELASKAKEKFGAKNHTFGEVCSNSDIDILDNAFTGKRYVESGKIRGKFITLEVNKSIVTLEGEVIGVVGSARDVTDYREELIKNGDTDVFKINEYINKDE